MEQFFSDNPYALYFIGLLFLIISNKTNKENDINKNIILIYIIFLLVNIFNIISLKNNIIVTLLICFIELQILNLDNESLIVKTTYKIKDYFFTMINKYKIISILVYNFLLKIILQVSISNFALKIFIYGIYLLIFIYIVSKIYRNEFKVKEFNEIEKIFNKNSKGFIYNDNLNNELNQKLKMVIDIEDKTFFNRKNSHNSISLEALMCKINREKEYIELIKNIEKRPIIYFITNCKMITKYWMKISITILKAIIYKNGIKRFIKRGYSTIEMQWIRNVGIDKGYENVYIRKIFELMYSDMFFKSLEKKRKYYTYPEYFYKNSREIYKKLILYVYLNTVPTFIYINKERVKLNNINEYYKVIKNEENKSENNILNVITKEELFIFIMGLSGKKINQELYDLYNWYILKYNIDINKVNEVLNEIKVRKND